MLWWGCLFVCLRHGVYLGLAVLELTPRPGQPHRDLLASAPQVLGFKTGAFCCLRQSCFVL